MHHILEKLLEAADNHAEDTGEDHNIGDLEALLSRAWSIMTHDQRITFIKSDEVEALVEAGAREEFSVEDLLGAFTTTLTEMESAVIAAGYVILTADHVPTSKSKYSWEFGREVEEDFQTRKDAIMDAYQHLSASKEQK
jgi:hypothetical protein